MIARACKPCSPRPRPTRRRRCSFAAPPDLGSEFAALAATIAPESEPKKTTEEEVIEEIEEVDSLELDSVPEIDDLARTGELPQFSLPTGDIVLATGEADVQLISRPVSSLSFGPAGLGAPSPQVAEEPEEDLSADAVEDADEIVPEDIVPEEAAADEVVAPDDVEDDDVLAHDDVEDDASSEPELSYDDEGGATIARVVNTQVESAADAYTKVAPPTRPTAAPGPAFQPPAPVGRAIVPAYEVDTDDDEEQLQREGSFRALVDLYRLRLADAPTATTRATLLHKIASVHEYQLREPEQAFNVLLEAFDLRPADDDIVASLDRVARAEGRVGELVERSRKNLHTTDIELKIILLGHLVYWYERVLGRGQEISPFVSEIERLDKSHPIMLRRGAQMAAANGDVKTQRELLVRALDRTSRRDEKVQLHLALASAFAGTSESIRHYEAAVANDSTSIVALQGLERVGREQGKHGQVEWCLERQAEVALTPAERIDALLKLADLHETKYLKRERAAEILERVVELEPAHPAGIEGTRALLPRAPRLAAPRQGAARPRRQHVRQEAEDRAARARGRGLRVQARRSGVGRRSASRSARRRPQAPARAR